MSKKKKKKKSRPPFVERAQAEEQGRIANALAGLSELSYPSKKGNVRIAQGGGLGSDYRESELLPLGFVPDPPTPPPEEPRGGPRIIPPEEEDTRLPIGTVEPLDITPGPNTNRPNNTERALSEREELLSILTDRGIELTSLSYPQNPNLVRAQLDILQRQDVTPAEPEPPVQPTTPAPQTPAPRPPEPEPAPPPPEPDLGPVDLGGGNQPLDVPEGPNTDRPNNTERALTQREQLLEILTDQGVELTSRYYPQNANLVRQELERRQSGYYDPTPLTGPTTGPTTATAATATANATAIANNAQRAPSNNAAKTSSNSRPKTRKTRLG